MVDWVGIILVLISLVLLWGVIVSIKLYSQMKKRKGLLYSVALIGFIALFLQSIINFLRIENIAEDFGTDLITLGNVIIVTKMLLVLIGYFLLVIAFKAYSKDVKGKK